MNWQIGRKPKTPLWGQPSVEETLFMNSKKLLVSGLCAAAVVSLSSAGAYAQDNKIAPKTLEFLEATTISGYVEASYTYNASHAIIGKNQHRHSDANVGGNDKNVGASGANQLRAFDNNAGFTANALKLVLEKPLGEGDWAAGYRADLIFGQDAQQLGRAEGSGSPFFDKEENSAGDKTPDAYGLYVEQSYVAFRVPIGNGIDFKFGRFVSLSGYEVIESPANLNFSRGLLFTFATPIGHTGLLGSYRFNDAFDAQLGLVNGWNTWADDDADPSIVARVGWRNPSGTASLGVSGYYGQTRFVDSAYDSATTMSGPRWFVDAVANIKPTEKVLLGVEALIGDQEGNDTKLDAHNTWWGVAGYVKVQVSDKVSLAGRAEYLHDSNGYLFDDSHGTFDSIHEDNDSPIKVYSLTGTVNFDVWKNMLLRLECRYDQATTSKLSGADNPPFDPENGQVTFAVDAVYSF